MKEYIPKQTIKKYRTQNEPIWIVNKSKENFKLVTPKQKSIDESYVFKEKKSTNIKMQRPNGLKINNEQLNYLITYLN